MMTIVSVIVVAIVAYCVGAIPTGYVISRLKGIQDIRKHGSGNIGATNVSRVLGVPYFFLIFLLDAGKAILFMYLIMPYFPSAYLYCFATLLLIGNSYSPFLQGTGGKGVATLCGLLATLSPMVLGVLVIKWCFALFMTRTVGIASVTAACSLPIYALLFVGDYFFIAFACCCALWIVWTHRANVRAYWGNFCLK